MCIGTTSLTQEGMLAALTLENLQVVLTQMEGHMPGAMAPTGS